MTIDYEPDAPPPRPVSAPAAGATRTMSREAAAPAGGRADGDENYKLRAKSAPEPEPQQAEERFAEVETQAFQAIYAIAGRVTVPATGEAKRVQIDEAQLDPALTVRTVPKRDQKAYLYAKGDGGARHAHPAGAGLALPRQHLRGQRPPAVAGAGGGARAGLRC